MPNHLWENPFESSEKIGAILYKFETVLWKMDSTEEFHFSDIWDSRIGCSLLVRTQHWLFTVFSYKKFKQWKMISKQLDIFCWKVDRWTWKSDYAIRIDVLDDGKEIPFITKNNSLVPSENIFFNWLCEFHHSWSSLEVIEGLNFETFLEEIYQCLQEKSKNDKKSRLNWVKVIAHKWLMSIFWEKE